jgi:hypothetical protein
MSREDVCLSYDIYVVHSLHAVTFLSMYVAKKREKSLVFFENEKRFSVSYVFFIWSCKNSAKEQFFETKLPKIDCFLNRFGRVVYLGIRFNLESSFQLCEKGEQ